MHIEKLEIVISHGFTENCYLISDSPDAMRVIVVDPGGQVKKIFKAVGLRTIECIVFTHHHYDHTEAAAKLVKVTRAPVIAHRLAVAAVDPASDPTASDPAVSDLDVPRLRSLDRAALVQIPVARTVEDGDIITVDSLQLSVLHTPGHTIDSICLYDEKEPALIAGDTLFRGAVGRTDLPTGSAAQQRESLRRLAKLPDETKVYPGHDDETDIGREKRYGYLGFA
jgi:glyoxylase-like metal-dependent hydrolase (beta-lactamase superfamily II)